jgi:hypothetical protein
MNAITRMATTSLSGLLMIQFTATAEEAAVRKAGLPAVDTHAVCVIATGSRIPEKGARCASRGRSYHERDIRATGATSAGAVLRLMEPAVTIRP